MYVKEWFCSIYLYKNLKKTYFNKVFFAFCLPKIRASTASVDLFKEFPVAFKYVTTGTQTLNTHAYLKKVSKRPQTNKEAFSRVFAHYE